MYLTEKEWKKYKPEYLKKRQEKLIQEAKAAGEEVVEVADEEVDTAKEVLHDIMTTGPVWAAGLPLAAKVENNAVYGK